MLQFCHSTNYRGTHLNLAMVAYTAAAFHFKNIFKQHCDQKGQCVSDLLNIYNTRTMIMFLHSHTLTQTASAGVPNYLPRGPTRFQWWFDHHISMMEKHQHAEPSTLQQGRWSKMTCTHWMCSLLHRKKTSQHCTAHKIYMCIYKVSTEWHVRNEEHSGTVGNVRIVKREITYNAFERALVSKYWQYYRLAAIVCATIYRTIYCATKVDIDNICHQPRPRNPFMLESLCVRSSLLTVCLCTKTTAPKLS